MASIGGITKYPQYNLTWVRVKVCVAMSCSGGRFTPDSLHNSSWDNENVASSTWTLLSRRLGKGVLHGYNVWEAHVESVPASVARVMIGQMFDHIKEQCFV